MRRALSVLLFVGAGYLVASLGAKSWAEHRIHHFLAEQGIQPVAMFSSPQPFNIVLWRVVAKLDNGHYIEAITGMLDEGAPETIEFPSNATLASALGPNEELDGLRWFTGDWLRYDDIGGKLVASDLRMGIGTGHYSFRFLLAERDRKSGQWVPVTPRYWHNGPGGRDMAALRQTLRRVWQSHPPLPLAVWDRRMLQPETLLHTLSD